LLQEREVRFEYRADQPFLVTEVILHGVDVAMTRSGQDIPGFTVCSCTEEVLELAKTAQRAMVIGGGSIYRQLLPYCDTAYITKVHANPGSDTFFSNLDADENWYLAETLQSGEENGISYEMLLYKRR
jgi:dihydrofolate reductase